MTMCASAMSAMSTYRTSACALHMCPLMTQSGNCFLAQICSVWWQRHVFLQRLARSIRRPACGLVNSREQLPHSHAVPKFATFW